MGREQVLDELPRRVIDPSGLALRAVGPSPRRLELGDDALDVQPRAEARLAQGARAAAAVVEVTIAQHPPPALEGELAERAIGMDGKRCGAGHVTARSSPPARRP